MALVQPLKLAGGFSGHPLLFMAGHTEVIIQSPKDQLRSILEFAGETLT